MKDYIGRKIKVGDNVMAVYGGAYFLTIVNLSYARKNNYVVTYKFNELGINNQLCTLTFKSGKESFLYKLYKNKKKRDAQLFQFMLEGLLDDKQKL